MLLWRMEIELFVLLGLTSFGKERDVGETHIESIEGDRFVDLVSDIDACINVLFTGEKKFRKSNRLSDNLSIT